MPRHDANETRSRRRFRLDTLLLAILLVALALRIWGVSERLPDPRVADAPMDDSAVDEGDRRAMQYGWQMWHGGARPLDLNPGTGDWPGLPFYVTLGSQVAFRAYDAIAHPGSSARSFANRMVERPAAIFLAGRLLSVALGVLSVFLIYRLGALAGGRGAGLFAAGFVAVMPFHVFSSQRIADPNLLSLVFMTAASIAMFRFLSSGAASDSIRAGIWVGLAGASKYVPFILVVPLALAHVGLRSGEKGPRLAIRWRPLAAGLAAALLAFALTSPFTFLDWAAKRRDMELQQARLFSEWAGLSSQPRALPTYLTQTLPELMTWAGYLLAVVGCVLLWRRGREGRILVLIPVLFVAAVGTLGLAQPRFVFPAVGILVVACAVAAIAVGEAVASRWRRLGKEPGRAGAAVTTLLLAGLAAWGVAAVVAERRATARPDSRHVAHAWVRRSIDPGEIMALDAYGPVFVRGPEGRRVLPWPFYASRTDLVRTAFRPEWLDGVRYYLTSSEITRRFEGSDARYAAEREFYAWIRSHGAKVWSTDPAATSGPQIDLYELPRSISTRETRDSIWAVERQSRPQGGRIARWTADLAQDFLLAGDPARAEEWARRGLPLRSEASRQSLQETCALALLQLGDAAGAEAEAREGARLYPNAPLFHVFRAMALEGLGRTGEAIEEYRLALPLSQKEGARAYVRSAIERLEARSSPRPADR